MSWVFDDILMHYGMPRRSGRYPWGSGENPYQHNDDFVSRVDEMRRQGFTYTDADGRVWTGDTAIAKSMNLTTSQFRTQLSIANNERRAVEAATAKALRDKGYSLNEIAEQMGYNSDSSIRALLNENTAARMSRARKTADFLKQMVDEKGMIDVGTSVERELGISRELLNQALYILDTEGYYTFGGGVPQVTNKGKQTNLKVLCPPGTEYKVDEQGRKVSSAIYDFENVHSLVDYTSRDGGETFEKSFVYPKSMDSSRLAIRYAEEGGIDMDGVIELRRGVPDLSLGEAHYAQVRILVDDNKYLKGMAIYSDDLPEGVDVRFNTNKKVGTPKLDVLKPISEDPDNPFGSLIKEHGGQSYYDDPDGDHIDPVTGKRQSLSLINKRSEEGDWEEWDDRLPSQFLSKQPRALINKQLKLTIADKEAEFDEICSLTNPTVKKTLLQSFSDDCDSAAVHLKAAALPRQKYKVILPVTSLKDNEVYAPTFDNGETVALVRYPHGGTFEIPILTVNNKQGDAKKMLGTVIDAIGINSNVAARLSGADFDGDTVMVIPCNSATSKVRVKSTPPLKGLEGFDPKLEYGPDKVTTDADGTEHYYRNGKEYKIMKNTQKEMGTISNLITDMTLRKGVSSEELARAVRHSMVVIDAAKHKLDYKQSERDNDIESLKNRYQGTTDENGKTHRGASTLISRAKSQQSITKRKGSPTIDPETGEYIYKETDQIDTRTGKKRTQKSTKMAEAKDARTLISDARSPAEVLYADYANKMKALANQARKEMVSTGKIEYKASARETYQAEVDHLIAQLNVAEMNRPRERQAQRMANVVVAAKKKAYPDLTKKEIGKLEQQELNRARQKVGAKRTTITINDREWEAIQSGAISENVLKKILDHADIDEIRKRATPRQTTTLSTAKVNKIATMNASGYSISEIAKSLGVSSSTVSKYLKGRSE